MRVTIFAVIALLLAVAAARPDEALEEAREALRRGRYRAAAQMLETRLAASPDDRVARMLRGRLLLETGEYDRAEPDLVAVADDSGETAPVAEELLVELLLLRGRTDEALARLDATLEKSPDAIRAAVQRGRALRLRGRRSEARDLFRALLNRYNRDPSMDAHERLSVAVATIHLAELTEDTQVNLSPSMRLLDRLTRDDPELVEAFLVKGDLLVKWQKDVDARKEYRKALKVNPRHAEVLRGMAESYAFRMNLGQAMRQVSLALKTNPRQVSLLCFQAGVKIADYEYDAARALLDKALEVNPSSTEARTLLGAMAFVTGDRDTFEAEAKKVLEVDPTHGDYYVVLAQILESHRRFTESVTWARKALETDPTNWGAAFTLGRNLLNIGQEEEAFELFDRAERLDPYPHIWRKNYLELYDAALSKFIETKTKNFILRIHASESRTLRDIVGWIMERAYEDLGDKYGHRPKAPILVEVFHVHADFAARTIGMPGLGALGACFGPVITLDSPSARDPGAFAWASTAWHELAHSVTLGLSKGRVPRWLTEGLSVYEERKLGAHYERRMERQLYDTFHNDKIPKIAKFNAEFRSPRVMFAYFLGGLMCEYIEQAHGFDAIREMLRLYGEDKRDVEVFRGALGVSLDEYDAGFRRWLDEQMKDWKLRPNWDNDKLKDFRRRSQSTADDFEAHVGLAEAFLQRGNVIDSGMAFEKARRQKADHPRVLILKGHFAMRNKVAKKAREFYEKALAQPGGEDFDARFNLAAILVKQGELEAAKASFETAKRDFPFAVGGKNPYAELAKIHEAEGATEKALAEKRRIAELVETEIDARLELASWAEQSGDAEEAARWLEEVVLIYPLRAEVDARYARVLRQLKRWDLAAMMYRMAIELKPEDGLADLHADLAEVEMIRGNTKEAKIQAYHALELDPEHPGAKALLKRLD